MVRRAAVPETDKETVSALVFFGELESSCPYIRGPISAFLFPRLSTIGAVEDVEVSSLVSENPSSLLARVAGCE